MRFRVSYGLFLGLIAFAGFVFSSAGQNGPVNLNPPHYSKDASVRIDYPIVYVRAPRKGNRIGTAWPEIQNPVYMDEGADLMLLHPDGKEEVLVKGGKGSITDPMVSFDGESVFYAHIHDLTDATASQSAAAGADIYKIHVPSRKIVRLTHQEFTPNTGAAQWSKDFRTPQPGKNYFPYGVFNLGPCPLPGGKIMFTSNRNGFRPPKRLLHALQLFVMDEDGGNIECIGHLNLGCALHPVVLTDGRVMFSTLESQGLRSSTLWGLWTIHPDGTNWAPMASAFLPSVSPTAFHFQTQLTDGSIVAEEYYNLTSSGFGSLVRFPVDVPSGESAFGPGYTGDPRNPPLQQGWLPGGKPRNRRLPFSPFGIESLTRFALADEGPAARSNPRQRFSPRVGKVTHPSGAPNNHLLLVWSPGPVNGGYTVDIPAVNSGIYLMKDGKAIDEPGQMLLIKNDPDFNAQWPRALVSYKRIYGIDEPKTIAPLANDGSLSPQLPAGTPFGLVGTSSFYKRESYPNGKVHPGTVTAAFSKADDVTGGYLDLDPFNPTEPASLNWTRQGADAGLYSNSDIHAVRILVMEPTTDRQKGPKSGRTFHSHANERLRILGEIPLRKFLGKKASSIKLDAAGQPIDPDGNPDTSFLAKIPADVAFTFQTLDKDGMVLNMSQTWHQLRPGEIRHNCGGCHAHSQEPTHFKDSFAARPDYEIFDLVKKTPLITAKANDQSGKKWDVANETGLRYNKGVNDVEYYRDVKPIFDRSCVACHTRKSAQPAGNLVLDDDELVDLSNADDVPGTYYRLAMDYAARFGRQPLVRGWRHLNASRYVRMFQSRRSLLIWKIYGKRLDGWHNDDFPTETTPGDASTLSQKGKKIPATRANIDRADIDYIGSAMPPPAAVVGSYKGPDGQTIKVAPLSDEDRRTLVRWIDLGCPIDLDYDSKNPKATGYGWMIDDQRPTLTLNQPRAGSNPPLKQIRIGMYDYRGLDLSTFTVSANFKVNGIAAGKNLASEFKAVAPGIWELSLDSPITIAQGTMTVSVKDRNGNVARIERKFSADSK